MRVLNGGRSPIGLAGKVVVPVRRSVTGRPTRTNRSTRCIYDISRRSLAVKLIKVARTTLEVLLGGFSGVKNTYECTKF